MGFAVTERWGWEYVLELGNGALAIVTGWLVVFLVYHVFKVGSQRRVWSWNGWKRLPQALQLAVSFLAVTVATFLVALVIWLVRYRNESYLIVEGLDTIIVSFARVLSVGGFLCALRVVTRPMRLQWPWIGAVASCVLYLAWSLLRMA